MKTLQDQYKLIKEGKGHKGVFLKEAKQMFPNYIRNAATFEEASNILKDKNVISENLVGIEPINTISRKKESYETAFENFLKEARKKNDNDPNAEIKKVSQQVEDKLKHNFDRTDKKNPDNQIFGEIMKGYYCEMKDPKNADKTEEQLRDIVLKNLAKDPIYYTKNGMFGEKGVGVEMDVPGLGEPKEPKGKYKSSGYGDLKESKQSKQPLKEYTDNNFSGQDTLMRLDGPSYEAESAFKEFFPMGYASQDDAADALIAHDKSPIKARMGRYAPMFVHVQYHEFTDEAGEKYRVHQTQYYNSNFKDSDPNFNPRVTVLTLTKLADPDNPSPQSQKDIRLGQMAVKTDEYIKDLNNLNIGDRVSESLQESKLRKVINSMIKQELITENKKYQKTIKEIEKTSKLAELTTKMEALDKAIEEKNSRLNSIEESEEMRELVDNKAIKELKKEVKLLEKYKGKVLKMYEKLTKTKTTKKEIIDEDEVLSEAPSVDSEKLNTTFKDLDPTVEKVKKNLEDMSKLKLEEDENIDIAGIISKKYPNISNEDIKSFIDMHSQDINAEEDVMDEFEEFLTVNPEILNLDKGENELPQEIINQIIPMYAEEGMEIEDIASMYPEMYNEVVEFLEGYDLGLDYDI